MFDSKLLYAEVHCPQILTPQELDAYLERGWFRMGQNIFTTNFLNFKDHFYSAIWLRIELNDYTADKQQQKIFKHNANFRTAINPAVITEEKEELFVRYKESVPFDPPQSITSLLMGKSTHNVFNTHEVCVYDEDKLIAAGFFDLGSASAAGISSIYDPAYKKFSLGKFLIYLKIAYCKQQGMRYFYPGYFVPGYSLFDYKLSMGSHALQFLSIAEQKWLAIKNYGEDYIPLKTMQEKLTLLQRMMTEQKTKSSLLHYEYFDANLIPELVGAELFDVPVFLRIDDVEGAFPMMIFFDVRDTKYHLVRCFTVWSPGASRNRPGFYDDHLLKVEQNIFASDIPEMVVAVYNKIRSQNL
jgi:arginyl-tRNA--protein-N-Asp/Glu arginylyltransferase